jgi:type II secretory pathway predicted ATPase ExeA
MATGLGHDRKSMKNSDDFVLTSVAHAATLRGMVRESSSHASSPFSGPSEPATFYRGPAQEEALARLEWLLTERQRCGLVVAGSGMGKSHLAVAAARRLGGLGAEVTVLSLAGLPAGEWLDLLLDRLPLDPASRQEAINPWLKLENHLRENAILGRPVVFIFDDVDRAPADARAGIGRLVASTEPRFATTMIVATARPEGIGDVPEAIRQRATVRIELSPWGVEDVAAYVADNLCIAGRNTGLFTEAASATICRFANGVPEIIRRLAHLSLAAADSGGFDRIDAATVEEVWRELSPWQTGREEPAGEPVEPSVAAPTPVRVVRRLWG